MATVFPKSWENLKKIKFIQRKGLTPVFCGGTNHLLLGFTKINH
jgi:hypothetical protein